MKTQPLKNVVAPKRMEWTPIWEEFFVSLMVDEVSKGRKAAKGFSRHSWCFMAAEFNKEFSENFDQQQLKNHFKNLKRDYKIMSALLGQSGFSWDQNRKMVAAKADVWDRHISAHPEAKPYRTKGLPLYEKMHIICANGGVPFPYNSVEVKEKVDRAMRPVHSPEPVVVQKSLEWAPDWDEFFVGLMVDETNIARKVENGFTEQAWCNMVAEFNRKFNQNLDQQQLKNRHKYFIREFNFVSALLDQGGFSWDKIRKVVKADAAVWDRYLSAQPEAKPYKTKQLPLYEDFCVIFGKASTDGRYLCPDKSLESPGVVGSVQSPITPVQNVEAKNEEASSVSREAMYPTDQHKKRHSVMPTSSNHGKRVREGGGTSETMAGTAHGMATNARCRVRLFSDEQEALKECIQELMEMEGLDDDLFIEACSMLKDEKNVVIFMTLKGERRFKWVKKMCGGTL